MQLVEGGLLLAGTDVVDDLRAVAEDIILVALVHEDVLAAGAPLASEAPQQVVLVLHQVGVHAAPAGLLHRLADGRAQPEGIDVAIELRHELLGGHVRPSDEVQAVSGVVVAEEAALLGGSTRRRG